MSAPLDWYAHGRSWPLCEASRFVHAAALRWHVQILGDGPPVLLVHGTGASTHSWRLLAPLLAARMRVVSADLPGHAFTSVPSQGGFSLPAMASALSALLDALALRPAYAVGHSAGAAILARMCLDGAIAPAGLASLNGALLPPSGFAGALFSPFAKLLVETPGLSGLFAWHVSRDGAVERLLRGTGSSLDPDGVALYRRLATNPLHARSALAMMAQWDLRPLARDLPRLAQPILLVAAQNDRAIAPEVAARVQSLVPSGRLERLPGVGHLAHEEVPHAVAGLVLEEARRCGALA